MANRNRYDEGGWGARGRYGQRGSRSGSDFERGNYGSGRAGNYEEDREENYYRSRYGYGDRGFGSSENEYDDYGSVGRRGYTGEVRRNRRDLERESYLGRAGNRPRYGGYSSEDDENYGASRRGGDYGQSDYGSRERYSDRGGRSGFSDPNWTNDYGGGGTYGGYAERGYTQRGGGYRRNEWDEEERGERGWLERAGDEVASWFGYGEDDDRRGRHRGRGPRNYTRSDERIREDINDRLTDDYMLDASDIEVEVNDGDVVLTGTVESRRAKRLAEDIAEEVSGVKNVENRLRVNQQGGSAHSDRTGRTSPAVTGQAGTAPVSENRDLNPTGISNLSNPTETTGAMNQNLETNEATRANRSRTKTA